MKIYEILSEGVSAGVLWKSFLRMLPDAEGKLVGREVDAAFEWLAKAVSKSGKADEELASAWVAAAKQMDIPVAEAIRIGEQSALNNGIDAAIVKSAAAKAEQLGKPGVWEKLTGWFKKTKKKKAPEGNHPAGPFIKGLDFALVAWGVSKPIWDCYWGIDEAMRNFENKVPGWDTQDRLQANVQAYMTECVGQLVALGVGRKLAGFLSGGGGLQNLPFLGGEKMLQFWGTLNATSKAAFTGWLVSPYGQEAVAEWLYGSLFNNAKNSESFWGWAFETSGRVALWFSEKAGGLAKSGLDKILRFNGGADTTGRTQAQTNADNAASDLMPKGKVEKDTSTSPTFY